MNDALLTRSELQSLLRCSRSTTYRLEQAGTIVPVRIGGIDRFRRGDIERLVESDQAETK